MTNIAERNQEMVYGSEHQAGRMEIGIGTLMWGKNENVDFDQTLMEVLKCQKQREKLEGVWANENGVLKRLRCYFVRQDLVQKDIPRETTVIIQNWATKPSNQSDAVGT